MPTGNFLSIMRHKRKNICHECFGTILSLTTANNKGINGAVPFGRSGNFIALGESP